MKILLVEDDHIIGESIKTALQGRGYTVDWMKDGQSAITALDDDSYSLALLDLGLPRRSGWDVLEACKQKKNACPIIIITARDAIDDKIRGLDSGADDYVIKPFSIKELEARMRAVLRRHTGQQDSALTNGDIVLNTLTKDVTYRGDTHSLSQREYALLYELLVHPGAVLSKSQLESRLYGWDDDVVGNAIEVIIHGLRKKIGKDSIKNIRGLGWMVEKR